MAKTRLNRKGQVVPANANQRKERTKTASKKFQKETDHDAKKHPRHY